MYQAWGYDAWSTRTHASHHAWMAADGQRWTDYSAGLCSIVHIKPFYQFFCLFFVFFLNMIFIFILAFNHGSILERADADSTTAVASRSLETPWATSRASAQRRDSTGGLTTSSWESSLTIASKPPMEPHIIKATPLCPKRIEPEEITSAPTSDINHINRPSTSTASSHRLEDQSPSFDLQSSAFSPSPVTDSGDHHGDIYKTTSTSGRQQRKSCWVDGNDTSTNLNLWDSNSSVENSSPFRVPKPRHATPSAEFDAAKIEFPKESGLWNSGSAFTSAGQDTYKSGEKIWMSSRDAEECALSGGASKSLAFGAHGLKQEHLFDDSKHLSDYAPYGASPNSSVVSAANPFACPISGASSSYGYSYAPMFHDSKGYGTGWSDPYVDPHYSQFQGR